MARRDKSQRPGFNIDEDLDRENRELLRNEMEQGSDDFEEEEELNEGGSLDYNANVDKARRMKRRERDNIE